MKSYTYLWLALTVWLSFEYWTLNHHLSWSVAHYLQAHSSRFREMNLSTEPGRPISFYLGILGFGLILLTNPYSLRKKWSFLKKFGSLSGWLNFHIFCGLFGPTCIVFHSGFKVRGLVGISFWSMVIVAVSGVIGRYIYVQILREERQTGEEIKVFEAKLEKMRTASGKATEQDVVLAKELALDFVGLPDGVGGARKRSMSSILLSALIGDAKLLLSAPRPVPGLPDISRHLLAGYALNQRRAVLLEPFRKMLGYWHSFHLPFAFFMYVAAVIHIGAALMFGTSN